MASEKQNLRRINVGCGCSPTPGWINYDNSPALFLVKHPFCLWAAKTFFRLSPEQQRGVEFAKNSGIPVIRANAVHLPEQNAGVNVVYSSHMVEHLSREAAACFLREALRVLIPGGICRLVMPDLKKMVDAYCADGDADKFQERLMFQYPVYPTLKSKLQMLLVGCRAHVWMYDARSMKKLMLNAGFREVNILSPGESNIADPEPLDLRERCDESFYIEGIK